MKRMDKAKIEAQRNAQDIKTTVEVRDEEGKLKRMMIPNTSVGTINCEIQDEVNKYQKERNFEETVFEINKGLFLEVMGATDVVSIIIYLTIWL